MSTKATPNRASKSTATAAQKARILAWLHKRTLTTDQGRAMGCYAVAARIFDLRRDGHHIVTERFNGYASDGYSHKLLARYRLTKGMPHGKAAR
jgi:hypothetical protein